LEKPAQKKQELAEAWSDHAEQDRETAYRKTLGRAALAALDALSDHRPNTWGSALSYLRAKLAEIADFEVQESLIFELTLARFNLKRALEAAAMQGRASAHLQERHEAAAWALLPEAAAMRARAISLLQEPYLQKYREAYWERARAARSVLSKGQRQTWEEARSDLAKELEKSNGDHMSRVAADNLFDDIMGARLVSEATGDANAAQDRLIWQLDRLATERVAPPLTLSDSVRPRARWPTPPQRGPAATSRRSPRRGASPLAQPEQLQELDPQGRAKQEAAQTTAGAPRSEPRSRRSPSPATQEAAQRLDPQGPAEQEAAQNRLRASSPGGPNQPQALGQPGEPQLSDPTRGREAAYCEAAYRKAAIAALSVLSQHRATTWGDALENLKTKLDAFEGSFSTQATERLLGELTQARLVLERAPEAAAMRDRARLLMQERHEAPPWALLPEAAEMRARAISLLPERDRREYRQTYRNHAAVALRVLMRATGETWEQTTADLKKALETQHGAPILRAAARNLFADVQSAGLVLEAAANADAVLDWLFTQLTGPTSGRAAPALTLPADSVRLRLARRASRFWPTSRQTPEPSVLLGAGAVGALGGLAYLYGRNRARRAGAAPRRGPPR
jgi:hypothetical protein